jgi:hypothetical protein
VSEVENKEKIAALDWAGLIELWKRIERRSTAPDWPSGRAFEYLILRAFELDGAEITWPFSIREGKNTLEQMDGVIYVHGLALICEAKDYESDLNFEPIARLKHKLSRRPPGTIAACFASRGFTEEALRLTQKSSPQDVLLWYGSEVAAALVNKKMSEYLLAKYRHMVEYAVPDFKVDAYAKV